MDKRLKEINSLLIKYSRGNFDTRLAISPSLDETDAIINGINMLGEELRATTVSRNYFSNIFNSVSDMVWVTDMRGIIVEINKSGIDQLQYTYHDAIGRSTNIFFDDKRNLFKRIVKKLNKQAIVSEDTSIVSARHIKIPVRLTGSAFMDEAKKKCVLFTAANITSQIKMNNLIVRAIIDTQENERQRLAKDLHDSLIQQLSGIKFFISSTKNILRNTRHKSVLDQANESLTEVISEVRDICFNLMPKTLQDFSLVTAIKEFCNHVVFNNLQFQIVEKKMLPPLPEKLKIDMYRLVQEFVSNTIKHSKGTHVRIEFDYIKKHLLINLLDNGVGFNVKNRTSGMGLQNAMSRVKSYYGEIEITSSTKGTQYNISILLKNNYGKNVQRNSHKNE